MNKKTSSNKKQGASQTNEVRNEIVDMLGILMNKMDLLTGKSNNIIICIFLSELFLFFSENSQTLTNEIKGKNELSLKQKHNFKCIYILYIDIKKQNSLVLDAIGKIYNPTDEQGLKNEINGN